MRATEIRQKKAKEDTVVTLAIWGNLLIALAKFGAWFFSRSPSLLAEAIHSLADTVNQGFLYLGIHFGRVGPTRDFPLGRAASRYLWNLISAIGVFVLGFGVTTFHGVRILLQPNEYSPSNPVGPMVVLLISFTVESVVLRAAYKKMRDQIENSSWLEVILYGDNPTTTAVFLEDLIAVFGVIIALIGYWLSAVYQSGVPDAIASILIGLLLGFMAMGLAFVNGRLLMGRAVDEAKEDDLLNFIEEFPSVEKVIQLRTQIIGPNQIIVSAEIEFHGGILLHRDQIESDAQKIRDGDEPLPILVDTVSRTVRTLGNEINRLEQKMRERFPEIVSIHLVVN